MKSKSFRRLIGRLVLVVAAVGADAIRANAQEKAPSLPGPETETVLSTYHVRAGQEQAFLAAANRTWEIYRRLDVVLPRPHTLVRKVDEGGHTIFVELFTWRSADTPDKAPAEIKAAWKDLEALCKRPDGQSGIEFEEVTVAAMD